MNSIAERLIAARTEAGLTQGELAAKARVRQSTIGNIEAGIRKRPRELLSIAAALGVNAQWLQDGKGSRYSTTLQQPPAEYRHTNPLETQLLELFRALPVDVQHEAVVMVNSLHTVVFPGRSRANPYPRKTTARRRSKPPAGL